MYFYRIALSFLHLSPAVFSKSSTPLPFLSHYTFLSSSSIGSFNKSSTSLLFFSHCTFLPPSSTSSSKNCYFSLRFNPAPFISVYLSFHFIYHFCLAILHEQCDIDSSLAFIITVLIYVTNSE